MKKAGILITIAAAFTMATSALGATNGTITGVVKDIVTGNPISGATINDGGRNTATTNGSGVYTLSEPAGSYTLKATMSGYQTTWQVNTVSSGVVNTVNWSLTAAYGNQYIPATGMNYSVLAWNDLGMHCDQDDYSYFMVLPPFNTLHVQVVNRNGTTSPIMSGITVSYAFAKKTDSTLHTNWWTYQSQYGFNQPANIGITGTPLAGTMVADANNLSWVATGIPITPYDDDGTWDPYGTATITVKDSVGNVLQTASVLAPVSTEMMCSNCHGTTNPQLDILTKHDALSGTTLVADYNAGTRHACSQCHSDNAVGAPGVPGVESLSLAMHNFHKDKMTYTTIAANTTPDCYNCHPGPRTQCLRGIMERAGKSCHDCHGDMYGMTTSMQNGRQPWLQEPGCSKCHDAKHAENASILYRNSIFQNAPNNNMSGKLYCEACHNSTHGEHITSNAADPTIPNQFQGDSYWIWNCNVCHNNKTVQQMHH
ncbi:MAG TPA: carboxypeptidase-like regulatory domain-containing protein [Geobacteraceae bacterium]